MARTSPIFNNFTGGERSPKTVGRTDTKAYFASCSEITNMWVAAQGGVEKRPGFKYIAPVTQGSGEGGIFGIKMTEFKFSSVYDQNYVLCFTEGRVNFFTEGGIITTGYGTPYYLNSIYSAAELPYLRFNQNLDEIIITCPFRPTQRLIRYSDADWEFVPLPDGYGPWEDENEDYLFTVSGTDTTGYIYLDFTEEVDGDLQTGSYLKIRGNKEFSATISGADQFTQGIYLDAGDKGTVSISGTWVATAMLQKSYDEGQTWYDYLSFTGNSTREILETVDNTYYRVGVPADKYTSGELTAVIAKNDVVGKVLITGYMSATRLAGEVIDELPSTRPSHKWAFSEFSVVKGYPATSTYYEGRLIFGGSYNKPQTIWASKVDDYFNFDTGPEDDDAYNFTILSKDINNILWMVGDDVLRVGTIGGEWRFGKRDEPTTPTNVEVRKQTNNGSANVDAILINHVALFVQQGGTKLRSMYYDYASDRYISPEISIIAEHLARKGIKEIKFSKNPDPIVWMVSDEGTLVACTYNTEQEIVAFHEHETQGTIHSVAVIPGVDRDEVWIAVDRGGSGIYIEQLSTQFWTDIEDAIYLDSAITAETSPEPMTSVGGLSHLIGKTVKVVTDGSVHPDCVVSEAGTIDLNWSAYKVHVGLGYTATVKTMPIEPGVEGGSSVGHKKKGFRVSMGLYRTNHCKLGTATEDLDIIPFRSSAMNMNQAIPEYTGVKKVWLNKGITDEFSLMAVSDVPLPFALTYISPVIYSSPS
jgi:hypothetical protein